MNRRFFCGLIVCLALGFGRAVMAQISFNIYLPDAQTQAVDSLVPMAVGVAGPFDIQTVTASVEDRLVDLVYTPRAFPFDITWRPGWTNQISLAGLAPGHHQLTFTAVDMMGNTGKVSRIINYDRPPVLTILSPAFSVTENTELKVAADGVDDNLAGCALRVWLNGFEIVAGTNHVETTISLQSYTDGQAVSLRFEAWDANHFVTVDRGVRILFNARLVRRDGLTGDVLDLHAARALLGRGDGLWIRERPGGPETWIPSSLGSRAAWLSPQGAVFALGDGGQLFQWRDGSVSPLAPSAYAQPAGSLQVAGNYASWFTGNQLVLQDLRAATNEVLTSRVGNNNYSLAANGDVAWWESTVYQIFWRHAGQTSQLTHDTDLWNVFPLTDGQRVVYRKNTPCCQNQTYGIAVHDGVSETILIPLSDDEKVPWRDYQIRNGWVAYFRIGNTGIRQVWRLSPANVATQVSIYGTDSFLDTLADDGSVTFRHEGHLLLAPPTGAILDLGPWRGTGNLWFGNGLVTIFDRRVYEFDLTPAGLQLHRGNELDLRIIGAFGQNYNVESSADLNVWDPFGAGGQSARLPVDATLSQRFFRFKP